MRLSPLRLLCCGLAALSLSACTTIPSNVGISESSPAKKQEHLAATPSDSQLTEARTLWESSFRKAGSAREELQLSAIEMLLSPEYTEQASIYLNRLIGSRLNTPTLRARKQIAEATLTLHSGQPAAAFKMLPAADSVPRSQGLRVLDVQAQALLAMNEPKRSLDTRMLLTEHLTDPKQIRANDDAIWRLLSALDSEQIYQWAAETSDYARRGWLALAYIEKTSTDTGDLGQRRREWDRRYPNHPAQGRFIAKALPDTQTPGISSNDPWRDPAGDYGRYEERAPWPSRQALDLTAPGQHPRQVALLLPQSGSYAGVGQAILAGFFTAYYQDQGEARGTQVRVYNLDGDSWQTRAQYDRAVAEGADFVVGPLIKDSVSALANSGPLPVPVLTLNYLEERQAGAQNFYQFGLLPEDEAEQAAERAIADGRSRAVAFFPDSEWGERLGQAFQRRFSELGGIVLSSARFDPTASDYSEPIRNALKLEASEQRYKRLRGILNRDVKFQPHRRDDADLIFLAAPPRAARLLKPQFDFFFAGELPIYATSHLYSGREDLIADKDLNGIVYCDLPWLIAPDTEGLILRERLETLYPEAAEKFPRLAALGIDAYRIIPHLSSLEAQPYAHLEGLTGQLSVDRSGRVFRELSWATFEEALPTALPASEALAPVFYQSPNQGGNGFGFPDQPSEPYFERPPERHDRIEPYREDSGQDQFNDPARAPVRTFSR